MSRSNGKHMKAAVRYRSNSRGKHLTGKHIVFGSSLISQAILSIVIGTIIGRSTAYLVLKNSVSNEFSIGEIKSEIVETFDKNTKTKSNVYVKNTGDASSYIRASIIISWKDKDGKILDIKPIENVDYTINFSNSTNWIQSNEGYYYYKKALDINEETDPLIDKCIQIREYEDRTLEVSIATQAIQAIPSKAVIEAWNVNIEDGVLDLKE